MEKSKELGLAIKHAKLFSAFPISPNDGRNGIYFAPKVLSMIATYSLAIGFGIYDTFCKVQNLMKSFKIIRKENVLGERKRKNAYS